MAEDSEYKLSEEKTTEKEGQFAIHKIYVKDISFETPNSPDIFGVEWNPAVNMQVSNEANSIKGDIESLYEVVLTVTVTVTLGEKTAYLIEVQQAGIFQMQGFPEQALSQIAATVCPNILFPFAREVVSDTVTRGGFPQLLLAPVNFEALYQQQLKQTAGNVSSSSEEEVKH